MGKIKHIPMDGLVRNQTSLRKRISVISGKVAKDLQQQVFCVTASQEVALKVNPNKFATITEKGIDPFLYVRCPFCLSYLPMTKFLISLMGKKKGFDRGKGKCPECGQGMQLKTLQQMRTWMLAKTPEEGVQKYAVWVYEYRRSGFFQKIKFAQFNSMLKSMGWSRDFWNHYKVLKGDLPSAEQQKKDSDDWAGYEESFQ